MAPKYTLTYFNGRGLAEFARLILAQAEVEYEDKRVDRVSQWPELKPETPFGKLPTLTVNGEQISESRAIARFLAKEHGLAGKTPLESARADAIVDAVYDMYMDKLKARFETEEEKKEAMLKKWFAETLPTCLNNLEKLLAKNGNNGYLVGDSLTWADIILAGLLKELKNQHPDQIPSVLEAHKPILKLKQKVLSLPAIKQWIDKRPVTDF